MHACAVQCDARLPSGDRSVVGRGDHGCDLCTASEQPGICHGARLGEPVARVPAISPHPAAHGVELPKQVKLGWQAVYMRPDPGCVRLRSGRLPGVQQSWLATGHGGATRHGRALRRFDRDRGGGGVSL